MDSKPVAVVTGGGGGIGAACARRLADSHTIVVTDANAGAAEKVAAELASAAFDCDVASAASVEAVIARIEDEVGPIAKLVHTAGIIQDSAYAPEEFDQERWDLVQA